MLLGEALVVGEVSVEGVDANADDERLDGVAGLELPAAPPAEEEKGTAGEGPGPAAKDETAQVEDVGRSVNEAKKDE